MWDYDSQDLIIRGGSFNSGWCSVLSYAFRMSYHNVGDTSYAIFKLPSWYFSKHHKCLNGVAYSLSSERSHEFRILLINLFLNTLNLIDNGQCIHLSKFSKLQIHETSIRNKFKRFTCLFLVLPVFCPFSMNLSVQLVKWSVINTTTLTVYFTVTNMKLFLHIFINNLLFFFQVSVYFHFPKLSVSTLCLFLFFIRTFVVFVNLIVLSVNFNELTDYYTITL